MLWTCFDLQVRSLAVILPASLLRFFFVVFCASVGVGVVAVAVVAVGVVWSDASGSLNRCGVREQRRGKER